MDTVFEQVAGAAPAPQSGGVLAPTVFESPGSPFVGQTAPASASGLWRHLPSEVASRYQPANELAPSNSRRELWLTNDTVTSEQVVLKLVASGGFTAQPELVALAGSPGAPMGIPFSRVACAGETGCEIQRFIPGQRLTQWIQHNAPLDPATARTLLLALQRCTGQLGSLSGNEIGMQWAHCDMKPDNILVTHEHPLTLELVDFGSAIEVRGAVAKHLRGRTIAYSPPELAHGTAFPNSDLWSVGVIVLEALTGKHPLDPSPSQEKLSADALDIACRTQFSNGWEANKVCDESGLNTALEGLITAAPLDRWSHQDFAAFVRGEPVQNNPRNRQNALQDQPKIAFEFEGVTCQDTPAVAETMARNWPWGLRALASDSLRDWLRGPALRPDLADAARPPAITFDPDMLLLRFIYRVQPSLPPTWKGMSLETSALLSLGAQELQRTSVGASPLNPIKAALRHLALVRAGMVANDSCARISASWERFEFDLRQAQHEAISAGAPTAVSLTQDHIDAQGLVLACDPGRLDGLRGELARAFTDNAARNQWFFLWGREASALTPGQVCVLCALLYASVASPWSPTATPIGAEPGIGGPVTSPTNIVVLNYRFGFHRHLT